MANKEKLYLRDAEILSGVFRNFSGKAGKYNAEGDRFFNVVIPNELVDTLLEDGWNVKAMKNDEDRYFMKVKVSYRFKPPKIVLITSKQQVLLDEEDIKCLDWEEIVSANIAINPSYYTKDDGRRGVSAYLQSLYVTIEEDPFEAEYAHLPVANGLDEAESEEEQF